jgi:hypothetical protein
MFFCQQINFTEKIASAKEVTDSKENHLNTSIIQSLNTNVDLCSSDFLSRWIIVQKHLFYDKNPSSAGKKNKKCCSETFWPIKQNIYKIAKTFYVM